MKREVATDAAPKAVGPYSQGIEAGGWLWVSGQIALDPETGRLVDGGIEDQARRVLENLRAVVEAAGCGLERVIRTTVYLTDMDDFDTVNRVYATYFQDIRPARACVEVARLPKGARVEMDAVALVGESGGIG